MENARRIREGLTAAHFAVFGGVDAAIDRIRKAFA
jgi:hypothetical protein